MFGYFVCNKNELDQDEINRYQGVYCGLCKTLEKRFGQMSRLSLNYEMTFLILFLSALYEPMEQQTDFRCALHPTHKKTAMTNRFTNYAADMTVALAYYKCLDDWNDEKKHLQHSYSKILEKKYIEVKERCPRQSEAITKGICELTKIEKSQESRPDDAVNCFGRLLAELFVVDEDFWSGSLRTFGYSLGRFLYLMDATMDYEKDVKTGNYNPMFQMNKEPEEMEPILSMMIGDAVHEFEKLPIVQDGHLLRNILYSGVWQKYYMAKQQKEKKEQREEKHHG